MSDELRAAVAAGALAAEESYRPLLQAIVEVARAILGARASSIMLLAGWVAQSRQPLVVEDVASDPRFDRAAAERTGYVPQGLMAVPLLHEDVVLGVLNVLDRPQRSRFSLAEMDLLELFAAQAAVALRLLLQARRTRAVLDASGDDLVAVARLAATLDGLDGERRQAGLRMLAGIEAVLNPTGGRGA
jgi:GAF domain-containing protein